MKKLINIDTWKRKEQYNFFSQFDQPMFGFTVSVDVTVGYAQAKMRGSSFFLYYLFRALKAANQIENFRYKIIDNQVFLFDSVSASPTISRNNQTFGFACMPYCEEEDLFYENSKKEIERVQNSTELFSPNLTPNVIHFSSIPWIDFTSLSHALNSTKMDSTPKISFGKITEKDGRKFMPLSVFGHHALMDGYHVGELINIFSSLMR